MRDHHSGLARPPASAPLHKKRAAPRSVYSAADLERASRLAAECAAELQAVPPGRRSPAPAGRAALGLVTSEQSSREGSLPLSFDPEACAMRRARRCRSRTITGARLLDESVRRGGFRGEWLFTTLTYRAGGDWQPDHVRKLLNRCRARLGRRGRRLHYVWTAELQRRGAIHYHLMIWKPRGFWFPTFDKAGWWPHGSTQIATALNPVGYMAKYASKLHNGLCNADGRLLRYPKGARICGAGGLGAERWRFRYWTAPKWARDAIAADHGAGECRIHRIPGAWLHEESGRAYLSPWECAGFTAGGGGLLFVPKEGPPS